MCVSEREGAREDVTWSNSGPLCNQAPSVHPAPAWDGKERSLNWPLHFSRYFQSLKKITVHSKYEGTE